MEDLSNLIDEGSAELIRQDRTEHGRIALQLGLDFLEGRMGSPDPKRAFFWFTVGAEHGSRAAQRNLGDCYRTGTGTTKHVGLAFLWYRSAAKKDDVVAMQRLAYCYRDGVGCPPDPNLAQAWETSADQIRRHGRAPGGEPPPPCPECPETKE